jgi:hypothetical protein
MTRLRPDSDARLLAAQAKRTALIRQKRTDNLREHADRAKREKAEMRRGLEAGEIDPYLLIAGELVEWEPRVRRMRLRQLLPAIPGIGPASAGRILVIFEGNPELRLEGFTPARRRELARHVRVILNDRGPLKQRRGRSTI